MTPPEPGPIQSPGRARRWLPAGLVVAALAAGAYVAWSHRDSDAGRPVETSAAPDAAAENRPPATQGQTKDTGDSFLEAFDARDAADSEAPGAVLDNAALEQKFQDLLTIQQRLQALGEQVSQWKEAVPKQELQRALDEKERLLTRLNQRVAAFEKDLGRARKARPTDAVPAWLTGEVLVLIGGEPEAILPHLRRAIDGGLARPRALATLARTLAEANQFEDAFRTAGRALDQDAKDRYAWDAFIRTAFYTERFADVVARLDRTFPRPQPAWVADVRGEAETRQGLWLAEQKLRAAEQKADDLPRVRLVVEHRRFARDESGTPTTKVESTGTGEVILELFEDQAPATVANFLALVEQKQYDGTRFFLAEAAALVQGGDVKSRTGDPKDDGTGHPGYFIPDETDRPGARSHYRGSISMVNNGPHTTGSQFFLTLVPMPEMDGQFAVFGRVLKGQEVVDRITRGRTNLDPGHYGRIIPGDLLVRAEVVRKRNHPYPVVKDTASAPAK